jgi:hypothetical protein
VKAAAAALDWLAERQETNGLWASANRLHMGISGLSLLAFLSAGHTSTDGVHSNVVRRAVRALVDVQPQDGYLGGEGSMYAHCAAAVALAEAHGRSPDPQTAVAVRQASALFSRTINERGGWRYAPRVDAGGDASVTSWALQAIHAARLAGLGASKGLLGKAHGYLDLCTHEQARADSSGAVAYQFVRADQMKRDECQFASLTCAGLLLRRLHGMPAGNKMLQRAATLASKTTPPSRRFRHYHLYYSSHGMYVMGGMCRADWTDGIRKLLIESQRRIGPEAGSWGDESRQGAEYATAMNVLSLMAPWRYVEDLSGFGKPPRF